MLIRSLLTSVIYLGLTIVQPFPGFFLVLWPLLASHSLLLLRIFLIFFERIFSNTSTSNTLVRSPRVLTRSFPLYLSHLPNTNRVAIGLCFARQTCIRPYMRFLFVRPEFCPLRNLSIPKILLSSDSTSRRTPCLWLALPATGWTRDFHPIERALTRRTDKKAAFFSYKMEKRRLWQV